MPRGGKRPGAGAKPGNLNALKDGRHSPRYRQLLLALLALPEFRAFLLMAHRQQTAQERTVRRAIAALFPELAPLLPQDATGSVSRLRKTINEYLDSPLSPAPTSENTTKDPP